jgi:hypothetical protein
MSQTHVNFLVYRRHYLRVSVVYGTSLPLGVDFEIGVFPASPSYCEIYVLLRGLDQKACGVQRPFHGAVILQSSSTCWPVPLSLFTYMTVAVSGSDFYSLM